MDVVLVNIYNEGIIPWINVKGPLFGYRLAFGVFTFLQRDPKVTIELTTYENAVKKKTEWLKKQQSEKAANDSLELKETVKVVKNESEVKKSITDSIKVVESNEDKEIDRILAKAEKEQPKAKKATIKAGRKVNGSFVFYTDAQLQSMTKAQLKQILKDRKYTSGKYAPKYHDKHEELIQKIKDTQLGL